jgi:DNA-binding FadR family transcriptional regulator
MVFLKDLNVLKSERFMPLQKRQSLAKDLVDALSTNIHSGRLKVGEKLPSEASIEAQFGVSRTVVREAISRLQAAGLVETKHGIGTFILDSTGQTSFKITTQDFATLKDVVAVLELRFAIEVEAAALAAKHRTSQNVTAIATALKAIQTSIKNKQDAVAADFQFHLEIARATQNHHFEELMSSLGASIIPRGRLEMNTPTESDQQHIAYLKKVNTEHEKIYHAIRDQDAKAAMQAMRKHLTNSIERRRKLIA